MTPEELLVTEFFHLYPEEAARLLEQVPADKAAQLLQETSAESAAAVAQRMAPFAGRQVLCSMASAKAGLILGAMPLRASAGYLRRMESEKRESLLSTLPANAVGSVRLLLSFPEGTAGALMDPLAPVLPQDTRVGQALDKIRRDPKNVYYYLYVVDRHHRLVGALDLKELMMAEPDGALSSIMQKNVVMLRPGIVLAALAVHPAWADYDALPVADDQDIFLGMIRQRQIRNFELELARQGSLKPEWNVVLNLAELYWAGMRELTEFLAIPLTRQPAARQPLDKGPGQ